MSRIVLPLGFAALLTNLLVAAAPGQQPPADKKLERPQAVKEHTALMQRLEKMHEAGRYAELLSQIDRAVELAEQGYGGSDARRDVVNLAGTYTLLGSMLGSMALYERALPMLTKAEEAYAKLFGRDNRTFQSPHQTYNLIAIAQMHLQFGEPDQALPYADRALAQARDQHDRTLKLAKKDDFPDLILGDASFLRGRVLLTLGRAKDAVPDLERALKDHRAVYVYRPDDPGHPELAQTIANLGHALAGSGKTREAGERYAEALKMNEALYPAKRHPNGHPTLVGTVEVLADFQARTGDAAAAEKNHLRALGMYEKLFPTEAFPDGHPDMVGCLHSLGSMYRRKGEFANAVKYLERACAIGNRVATRVALTSPEARALAYVRTIPLARFELLSVFENVPDSDARAYDAAWESKSLITRILAGRRVAVRVAAKRDPKLAAEWDELVSVRRELAEVLFTVTDPKKRDQAAGALTRDKERLEQRIAMALGNIAREGDRVATPAQLAERLGKDSALIDFYLYHRHDGEKSTPSYLAFVLAGDGKPRRVNLGPAADIDAAVAAWQKAVVAHREDPAAAQTIRRLVWLPVAEKLGKEVRTVYVSPDGELARVPWAAIPGPNDGNVLLEQFAGGIGLVPHGPFLADALAGPAKPADPAAKVLVVGGVDYGDPIPNDPAAGFTKLDGTEQEADQIALAGGKRVVVLKRSDPTLPRLTKELGDARYLHLATHGFFREAELAAEKRRWDEALQSWNLRSTHVTDRVGVGAKNPLSFTGLALAGANRKPADGPAGVVFGEGLIGLELGGVELAVLSACESGTGERTEGEGVLGLPRVFHLAGCRNVIASLWRVSDDATPALMNRFYHELWEKKRPPMEALREAQLVIYRGGPAAIKALRDRGPPSFKQAAELPPERFDPPAGQKPARAATRDWAAFTLSGGGR